jgi:hypothetical protein
VLRGKQVRKATRVAGERVALEMQAELAACCTQMVDSDKALEAGASLRR